MEMQPTTSYGFPSHSHHNELPAQSGHEQAKVHAPYVPSHQLAAGVHRKEHYGQPAILMRFHNNDSRNCRQILLQDEDISCQQMTACIP